MADTTTALNSLFTYSIQNKKKPEEMMDMAMKSNIFDPTDFKQIREAYEESATSAGLDFGDSQEGLAGTKGGRELTAASVQSLGDSENALNSINIIEEKLKGREDIGGPVSGRFKTLTGDDEMKSLNADFMASAQTIGRYLEGGKLAEGDIARYQDILPNANDEASVRKNKIETIKNLIETKKKTDLETFSSSGFDVSGFAGGEQLEQSGGESQLSPEQSKDKILTAYTDAKANPDNPEAQEFITHFKEGHFDMATGKLKDEFRPKTEEEQEFEAIYGKTEPEEKKGFGEAFGELRGAEQELKGITEQQEALSPEIEETTQRAKDLSLVNNYERALENKDTDEMAQAFLDRLTDEDKAKIEELQKMTPEERETERQELLSRQKGTQEKLGKFGEQIDTATVKGEEAIKSNRGLETFGDVAEAGSGIIEAGKEGASTIGETFSRVMNENQDPTSTGVQVVGALGKFLGESAGALTVGAGKVVLPQGAEDAIGKGAAKAVNAVLETEVGQKGLKMAQAGGEDWEEFKKEHPTQAANLEGVVGIIEGVGTVAGGGVAKSVTKKGLKTTGGVAKDFGGKVVKGAKESFEKQAIKQGAKKAEKEAVKSAGKVGELEDVIMPKMTSKELNKASLEGRVARGKKSKLTGKAKDVVDASETIKKDADLIRSKIKGFDKLDDQQLSSKVDLEGNKIFNKIKPEMEKVELKADSINKKVKIWDKIKKQQAGDPDFEAFGGKKLQSNFENVLNEIKKGAQGAGGKFRKKNLNDLWELRQKYDKLVPDRIKNADSLSDSRAQYQKDVWLENRRILNDIITDTSNEMGSSTAKAFEEMSAFKRIRQNIASKTKLEKEEIGLTGKAKKKLIGTGATVGLTAAGTAVGLKGLQ